jgi:hypothetical protein
MPLKREFLEIVITSGGYFGFVVYRTNAVWPAVIIHDFANVANKVIIGSGL